MKSYIRKLEEEYYSLVYYLKMNIIMRKLMKLLLFLCVLFNNVNIKNISTKRLNIKVYHIIGKETKFFKTFILLILKILIVVISDEVLFMKKFRIIFIYSNSLQSAVMLNLIRILITFNFNGKIEFVAVVDNVYYEKKNKRNFLFE
jgi:hypothetical protein